MSLDDSDQLKVRLQGVTVCDGIGALENLGIIGVTGNSHVLTAFGRLSTNSRNNIGPAISVLIGSLAVTRM